MITVIILLILAEISIAQLTGNGLFEKARLAKEKQEKAQEKENIILSEYENSIGNLGNINSNRENGSNEYVYINFDIKNITGTSITVAINDDYKNIIDSVKYYIDDEVKYTGNTLEYTYTGLTKGNRLQNKCKSKV